ncbi:MAG: hypothetical protein LQ351_000648 [Letrouitia transgressa]|nr:MAG: hypothetical protein LQ351_000648 [Letrouitia transgressa]
MAGLIAMASVLVVVTIEMFFATRGAGHSHTSEYGALPNDGTLHKHNRHYSNGHVRPPPQRQQSLRPFRQADFRSQPDDTGYRLKDLEQSSAEHLVPDHSHSRPLLDDTDTTPRITQSRPSDDDINTESDLDLSDIDPVAANARYNHSRSPLTPSTPNPQKLLLQCLLLEAGILFHSIFIGLALSLAIGTSFIVLLVAISFHQTFEGLALGSRIAALPFPAHSLKPWLMALAYGTTTPVGQAVGLMVHGLYDQQGQGGLLMVGITNAVSSGLLLFAGLVELLAEDFLSDASYEVLRGRRRVEAWMAVVAGGALMALVGAWA